MSACRSPAWVEAERAATCRGPRCGRVIGVGEWMLSAGGEVSFCGDCGEIAEYEGWVDLALRADKLRRGKEAVR